MGHLALGCRPGWPGPPPARPGGRPRGPRAHGPTTRSTTAPGPRARARRPAAGRPPGGWRRRTPRPSTIGPLVGHPGHRRRTRPASFHRRAAGVGLPPLRPGPDQGPRRDQVGWVQVGAAGRWSRQGRRASSSGLGRSLAAGCGLHRHQRGRASAAGIPDVLAEIGARRHVTATAGRPRDTSVHRTSGPQLVGGHMPGQADRLCYTGGCPYAAAGGTADRSDAAGSELRHDTRQEGNRWE